MEHTIPPLPYQSEFEVVTPPETPVSPEPRWKQKLAQVKAGLIEGKAALRRFVEAHRVVRIGRMEIDITPLIDIITAPYYWVTGLFGGHARSRRRKFSEGDTTLKRIKLIRLLAMFGLAGVVLGIVIFFGMFAWYSRDLPQPGQVIRREGFSTKFYDRNGELLYDLFDSERRNPIKIDEVPDALKHATVAVEDKDFYKHQGFDVLTIVRIPYNLIVRRRVVGGSTLTQQLVKNVLLTNERTLSRKFKEFVLALQIERTFTKDQILEMYLNEAPYGGTAWGVGAAAEIYFNKPVSDLTLAESAILAGLPQRPTAYSPLAGKTDPETEEPLWKIRTLGVLRRMREDEYITEDEYNQAVADLDTVEFDSGQVSVNAPHFVFYVRDQLEELFGEDIVERGGLKVTTSLDLPLHQEAQQIVKDELEKVKDFNITNGAAMVMDPRTGEILSMVGSKDYFSEEIDGQFNVAVDGLRQPGSSIKPVTYLAMFERGFNPGSMLVDVSTTFAANDLEDPYDPKNYDGKFRGPVSLRNSLGSSLNVTAVKALAIVGVENFLQQAYDMGFVTLEPTEENLKRFGLAVTLGGAEVHLIDTVTAYSAFANGGTKVEPVSILKVEDIDGSVLFEHKPVEGARVMSEESAFLVNDVLSDNNARLMAFGANSLLNTGKPIAVKTGTTNDQRDNWTIGWSQEVIVGTWVGNNDNSAMTRVASGITGASPIWRNIIFKALDRGYGTPEWEKPEGVEQVLVDTISGYPEHDGFPSRNEFVIKGTLPALPDPIHSKVKLCRGENKLANEARVATGDYDEKEFIILREDDPVSQDGRNRWQEAIQTWINALEGDSGNIYKVPTEYCGQNNEVSVNLRRPNHETNYTETEIDIEVEAGSDAGIDKIEIIVNGEVKKTVNGSRHNEKMRLDRGRYEIWAKAYGRDGKTNESRKVKIGTGGEDWRAPDPTPTPTPVPATPAPTPTPTPVVVVPTPTPNPGGNTPPGQN